MSPNVCRSNAAYAVAGSNRLASTQETHEAFGKSGTFADYVRPAFPSIARELQVSVVGAHPDRLPIARRFADGINRRVRFRVGVVHGHAARFFLLLLFGIVGGQVGRNAVPGLAVIARAKQKLRADINRPFFIGTHVYRRVPVEPQFAFAVIRLRLDRAAFQRVAIHARDFSALRFGINVIRIRRIGKRPESVAAQKVFPTAIRDPAGIR